MQISVSAESLPIKEIVKKESMNHDQRTDEVYQGIQEAFYFSTDTGVLRSGHGVYDTVFDRDVSQSDQGRGRVFHISEIWAGC